MQRKNGRLQPGNCNIWRALIRQFPIVGQDPIRTTRGANGFGECDGACVTWLERGHRSPKAVDYENHDLGAALDRAWQYFCQAVRSDRRPETQKSLGRALLELGKRDEAAKHLQEAVRILKSSPVQR